MFDRLFASLMFFTRLPWWRLRNVPSEAFKHTIDFWPQVGWITGGTMAFSFLLFAQVLPLSVAIILAIATRLLLTGALHEDGLADFCDGMGGGTTRERTLAIMKDSHIGTYGVLGLIVYFALLYTILYETAIQNTSSLMTTVATILFSDVWGKSISSFIITLPYARDEEGAKAHVVYHTRTMKEHLLHLLRCALALSLPTMFLFRSEVHPYCAALLTPIVVFLLLRIWMKKKIGGYTGDCCGATFLICELSYLLTQLICLQT